jgi:hypothetical protein
MELFELMFQTNLFQSSPHLTGSPPQFINIGPEVHILGLHRQPIAGFELLKSAKEFDEVRIDRRGDLTLNDILVTYRKALEGRLLL